MSNQSNNKGRAYEYICLQTLGREITRFRPVTIIENSSFIAAKRAWEVVDVNTRETLTISAKAAVATLFDMEPLIIERDDDCLELFIQPDTKGEVGDVRDIIIVRKNIRWEIGLSIKHNHFAVKHSRLGKHLDFGDRWFAVPCSKTYWDDIKPIFAYLEEAIKSKKKWSELPSKASDVYIPILDAFVKEIKRATFEHPDIPRKMVEYLLGEFDFYKVISIDNKSVTQIQTYNLRGTLNHPSKNEHPKIKVPLSCLPTRIVSLDYKPGSDNTVELYMDGGWQFSFRIHNASTYVESSLKFDIQIIGMPASIISINCLWNEQ
jgi:hypothetical protein